MSGDRKNAAECRVCRPEDADTVVPLMAMSGPKAFAFAFSDTYEDQSHDVLLRAFRRKGSEFGYAQHMALVRGEAIHKGGLSSRFGEVVDHVYMELEL